MQWRHWQRYCSRHPAHFVEMDERLKLHANGCRAQVGAGKWDHPLVPMNLEKSRGGATSERKAVLEAVSRWKCWVRFETLPVCLPERQIRSLINFEI